LRKLKNYLEKLVLTGVASLHPVRHLVRPCFFQLFHHEYPVPDTLNPFLPRQFSHIFNIVCLIDDFHAHQCFDQIFKCYQSFRSPMLIDNNSDVLTIREKMFEQH
jgi:hypothetical protein